MPEAAFLVVTFLPKKVANRDLIKLSFDSVARWAGQRAKTEASQTRMAQKGPLEERNQRPFATEPRSNKPPPYSHLLRFPLLAEGASWQNPRRSASERSQKTPFEIGFASAKLASQRGCQAASTRRPAVVNARRPLSTPQRPFVTANRTQSRAIGLSSRHLNTAPKNVTSNWAYRR